MEGNTLKVDCSPGTLNRIRNDETFMRQKAAEILEEEFRTHGILFNEVIFASDEEQTQATPEIVESQNFSSEMAFSSLEDSQDFTPIYGKQVWLEAPTTLMLSLLE
ncbi:uncharacterized protein LOC118742271 isoform X2 [Rhagoletis pomonella]|uniref:uncharacterized protein LOC118742271 isoform X2 n=1 Tax=Rhagoletis pomonella TaxID=28610 RepID=UPI00177BE8A5|nr:uncharacterized protein LOC118742271 isoform X2 [Rhagoletis pomonella]